MSLHNIILLISLVTCQIVQGLEPPVVVEHAIEIDGKPLQYTSTCGHMPLLNHHGEPIANIFYTAYSKNTTSTSRPVTFCFNGGPGSSSAWLHIGFLGPKRIISDENGHPQKPISYDVNPYTLLEETDLVFIDPISAGFSYTPNPEHQESFFSTSVDISSFCSCIFQYIQMNNRWLSPKFILGESYGTIRAVGVAEELFDAYYIPIDGVILISSALDYQALTLNCKISYLLHFPTMAATAWYHQKLDPSLQKLTLKAFLQEVEAFCSNEYLIALYKGGALPQSEREYIAQKLGFYTGIDPEIYLSYHLTLSMERFSMEVLSDQELNIGGYDSRTTGYLIGDEWNWKWYWDPSAEQVLGPFNLCFNDYLKRDLSWKGQEEYKMVSNCIKTWDFEAVNSYLSRTRELATLLTLNPKLKVFFASGIYDLVTPYFSNDYVVNNLAIPQVVRENVTHKYYEAGHMMYLHKPSLKKLSGDLKNFYSDVLSEPTPRGSR